jgi:hypothetical protein
VRFFEPFNFVFRRVQLRLEKLARFGGNLRDLPFTRKHQELAIEH